MFGSRRGRPSLIGSVARTAGRTAVVVGTANAMSRPRGAVAPVGAEALPVPPPPAATLTAATQPVAHGPAAGGLDAEAISRLKQLADLHGAGVLTDAEFAEQKTRILAG